MKKILTILFALILTASIAGCKKESQNFKLGVIGPTTGTAALYGTSVKEGALLAANEINAAGGLNGTILLDLTEARTELTKGRNVLVKYNVSDNEGHVATEVRATFTAVDNTAPVDNEVSVIDPNIEVPVINPVTGGEVKPEDIETWEAPTATVTDNVDTGLIATATYFKAVTKIEIISQDSEGITEKGILAYKRLRDKDNINGLVGGTFSGVTKGIKDIAINDNMPVLTPTATSVDITLNAPNVFRTCYTDAYQAQAGVDYIFDTLNFTSASIVYNQNDDFSSGLRNEFKAAFIAKGGTIVEDEAYTEEQVDFSSIITKIKASGADVVYAPGYIKHIGPMLVKAKKLGMEIPFFGVDGWDGIEVDYADAAEGHYFTNHYSKTDNLEVIQNFVAIYKEKYGTAPSALAALAYDSVYTFVKAAKNAQSIEKDALITALADVENDGVTGYLKFDIDGDPIKPVSIIQLIDGEHVLLDKIMPE